MGYQESWLIIRPQKKVKEVLELALNADATGTSYARPVSVITLNQEVCGIPKGTTILWLTGDRAFHSLRGIMGGEKIPPFTFGKIIPIENIIYKNPEINILEGINLSCKSKLPSQNKFMERYAPEEYLKGAETKQAESGKYNNGATRKPSVKDELRNCNAKHGSDLPRTKNRESR